MRKTAQIQIGHFGRPHEGQGLKISADMGVPSERAFKYLPDGEKIVQKFELVMKRDACNRQHPYYRPMIRSIHRKMVAGNRDKQCQRSKPGFALLQRASARLSYVPYVCPPREFTVFDAVLALFDGSGCGFRHRGRDFDTEVEPHPKNKKIQIGHFGRPPRGSRVENLC